MKLHHFPYITLLNLQHILTHGIRDGITCIRDDPLLEINEDKSDWFWDHPMISLNYF